ncbi:MAG TPA: tripartite tricarboxylate transporter substrate binding protein [Ramlibacter sp.]
MTSTPLFTRRSVLLAAGAAASPFALAQAGDYPSKPVKVIVAFTAGGTTDILTRAVSQKLTEKLKQPFLVDNKPGAGGNLGTEIAARSAPDGYTLIVNSVGPIAVNPTLYRKLPVNPLTDLVPVVQIADVPNVLVVNPAVPAKTLKEFVAFAKGNPGKLNYGSTGIGTSSHLSGYMLGKRTGAEYTHIPYKGAEALKDLLAGRVEFMFATIPSVIQHIKSGGLRALAVTSVNRSRSMPDVPTVIESGFPNFEAGSWFGFFAPKGTPESVVATINKAVNEALPGLESQLVREGADPVGGSPAQFAQFIQKEYEKWRVVVRESGAVAE